MLSVTTPKAMSEFLRFLASARFEDAQVINALASKYHWLAGGANFCKTYPRFRVLRYRHTGIETFGHLAGLYRDNSLAKFHAAGRCQWTEPSTSEF